MEFKRNFNINVNIDAIAERFLKGFAPLVIHNNYLKRHPNSLIWLDYFADHYPVIYEYVERTTWDWFRENLDQYEINFIGYGDDLDSIYKAVINRVVVIEEE